MVSHVYTHKNNEDGYVIKFRRFSLDDLDQFADQFKAEFKATSVKSAKEEKWDDEAIWRLKSSIDAKTVDINQLFAAASSPKWIKVYLKASLLKSGVPTEKHEDVIYSLSYEDRILISQRLILDLPELQKNEPVVEEKKNQLPLVPGVDSQPPEVK